MAQFPALPLWTDAYLGDTTHLDATEHGAYLLLLIVSWRSKDCRIPDDDVLLAKYARCSGKIWKRVRPVLEPFFTISGGCWTQLRLLDEMQLVSQRRESAAANGRASALKRKGRHSAERPTERPTERQRNGNGMATTTPISTPIVVEDEPLLSETDVSSPDAVRPDEVVEAWNEMAKRRGLPTIRALTPKRKIALKSRIRDHPLKEWQDALNAIERSPFLLGENNSGWRASFDFLLQPSSFQKLIEGSYDRK